MRPCPRSPPPPEPRQAARRHRNRALFAVSKRLTVRSKCRNIAKIGKLRQLRVIPCLLLAALVATTVLAAQEQERVVRGLSFVGNRALDDYTLESAIATTKSSAWARYGIVRWLGLGEKRYFNEIEFRRDVVRLILLYRQSGFMNAVVDTSVRRTPRDVYITFRIHEGEPVRVARLDVMGLDGIFNIEKLKRDLPLQVGDPFNRFLMQASADTIVGRLRNSGYPYADVLRNFDSEAGILKAEVELDAQPGPRMRIGEVMIRGLRDVDTGTVRRVMSVRPGNLFKQDALYQTQRDLYGMGVFSSVNVALLDSVPPQETVQRDSMVRTLIQVLEGPAHQVRIGFGYATVECFRVQSGWTAHDFLGGARTLDLSARVSKLGAGTPTLAAAGIFCSLFRLCDGRSRKFLRDRRRSGAVTINAVRDRVNSLLDPSEGSITTATFLHASRLVGSQAPYEFNRGEIEVAKYYPLGRATVFAWRGRGGESLPRNVKLPRGPRPRQAAH